jgi:Uri superfamily endonuclease
MQVKQDSLVHFGRFQGGEPILVPQGDLLYLGSAMRGLASRVLRHALRTGDKPDHELYAPLLSVMRETGLVNGRFQPPAHKKLHWHIDYLLDETAVSLSHVILIRSQERLEAKLGEWLLAHPEILELASGLGASDVKGHTHLLRVLADEGWWAAIINPKSPIANRNG